VVRRESLCVVPAFHIKTGATAPTIGAPTAIAQTFSRPREIAETRVEVGAVGESFEQRTV
jgi:hypothetical protein